MDGIDFCMGRGIIILDYIVFGCFNYFFVFDNYDVKGIVGFVDYFCIFYNGDCLVYVFMVLFGNYWGIFLKRVDLV